MDRRIKKTKNSLKQEFLRLLQEKNISKITIKELTDAADINRGTFYTYYDDLYDLRDEIESDLLEDYNKVVEKMQEKDDYHFFILNIYDYIYKNKDIIISLFGEHGDRHFELQLKEMFKIKCLNLWKEHHSKKDLEYFDYLYNFTLSGCVSLMMNWIKNGFVETPKRMSFITEQIISHKIIS